MTPEDSTLSRTPCAAAIAIYADAGPGGEVSANEHTRLPGLDLLRVLAALLVGSFHLAFWSWVPESSLKAVLRGQVAFTHLVSSSWFGWVGVHIFFVISGFVIAYSASRTSASGFARSRFLRLFPAALICATLSLAALIVMGPWPLGVLVPQYLRSILFVPYGPWIDGAYWTLGVEGVFYAMVWAILILGMRQRLLILLIGIGLVSSMVAVLTFFYPDKMAWTQTRTSTIFCYSMGCTSP